MDSINKNPEGSLTPEQRALERAKRGLMSIEDQAVFDEILGLSPEALNEYQRNFINGRRGYLTTDQKRIFASVLIDEEALEKSRRDEALVDDQPSEALVKIAADLGIDTDGLTTRELQKQIKQAEAKK